MGGRKQVILACVSHDFSARRALFLIDGDFPWLRGEKEDLPEGIHRLPAYCVENLIACRKATVELLFESCGKRDRGTIQKALAWATWISDEVVPLIELFKIYAVANLFEPEMPTVIEGHAAFLTQTTKKTPPTLDKAKVNKRILEILAHLNARYGKAAVNAERIKIGQRLKRLLIPVDAVSGKDFLLPLLHIRCKGIVNQNLTRASLKLRLARHCDTIRFSSLAKALRSAAEGQVPRGK